MKFSINIESAYRELPFYDRLSAAKHAGFDYVEIWGWDDKDIPTLVEKTQQLGLEISCMGGDGPYSLCDPGQAEDYLAYFKRSLELARQVNCKLLAIHSNTLLPEPKQYAADFYSALSDETKILAMYSTLAKMAPLAEEAGVTLCLEALNVEVDHLGNFLKYTSQSAALIRQLQSPNVKILYDAYHMYLNEGKIFETIKKYQDLIGLIHIADAPGRHEPGTGVINFAKLMQLVKRNGYQGMVAFELYPETHTDRAVSAIKNVIASIA